MEWNKFPDKKPEPGKLIVLCILVNPPEFWIGFNEDDGAWRDVDGYLITVHNGVDYWAELPALPK